MKPRPILLFAACLPVIALAAGLWLWFEPPWESPHDRTRRLCAASGLGVLETERLISDMRESPLTREQLLELLRQTYQDPDEAELCEPCSQAVLDAAGKR